MWVGHLEEEGLGAGWQGTVGGWVGLEEGGFARDSEEWGVGICAGHLEEGGLGEVTGGLGGSEAILRRGRRRLLERQLGPQLQ